MIAFILYFCLLIAKDKPSDKQQQSSFLLNLGSFRLKKNKIIPIQTFCGFEENIIFPSRFKMGRACISMEKWYLSDSVCHVSTETLIGQVVQLHPMNSVCIMGPSRGTE